MGCDNTPLYQRKILRFNNSKEDIPGVFVSYFVTSGNKIFRENTHLQGTWKRKFPTLIASLGIKYERLKEIDTCN